MNWFRDLLTNLFLSLSYQYSTARGIDPLNMPAKKSANPKNTISYFFVKISCAHVGVLKVMSIQHFPFHMALGIF